VEGPAGSTHPLTTSTWATPLLLSFRPKRRDLQCALRRPLICPGNRCVRKSSALDNPYCAMQYVIMRHVVKDAKPLSEPVMLMLTSLASEPKHGYALLKDVEELSNGRVQLSTGTLYGAIRRLLEDRWIERFDQEDTSRDKQAYRLTARGRTQLNAELLRLRHLLQSATARLGLKGA
jgi:DNA-binding PadR family transcriptional regulator